MPAAVLTINLDALIANWRALDAKTAHSVETSAVIKADAYGLGVAPVGRALRDAGVKTFFVAIASEGAILRQVVGPEVRIFVFTGYMRGDEATIEEFDLIPLLNSSDQVGRFLSNCQGAACGLQLDTGMNRLGMESDELASITSNLPALNPTSIMSHLSCSDEPDHPQNEMQLVAFNTMAATLPKITKSLSATGGILLGADYHMGLTRPGIGIYGCDPFIEAQQEIGRASCRERV